MSRYRMKKERRFYPAFRALDASPFNGWVVRDGQRRVRQPART
jgi:hypothetical protein